MKKPLSKNAVKFMTEFTLKEKTLVDSNVLTYAYDKSSNKHGKAVEVLEKLLLSGNAVVSVQNLVEFARLVTEKIPKPISFEQARNIVVELSEGFEVIYYDKHVIADALSLSKANKMHFFDALLAATMEKENIKIIITEDDKEFRKIPWLKTINPFK